MLGVMQCDITNACVTLNNCSARCSDCNAQPSSDAYNVMSPSCLKNIPIIVNTCPKHTLTLTGSAPSIWAPQACSSYGSIWPECVWFTSCGTVRVGNPMENMAVTLRLATHKCFNDESNLSVQGARSTRMSCRVHAGLAIYVTQHGSNTATSTAPPETEYPDWPQM